MGRNILSSNFPILFFVAVSMSMSPFTFPCKERPHSELSRCSYGHGVIDRYPCIRFFSIDSQMHAMDPIGPLPSSSSDLYCQQGCCLYFSINSSSSCGSQNAADLWIRLKKRRTALHASSHSSSLPEHWGLGQTCHVLCSHSRCRI